MTLFRSGWARLTVVLMVLVELVLVAGAYHAWTELNVAEQRLASLPVPPPEEHSAFTAESLITYGNSDSLEIIRQATEDSERREYEFTTATIETRTEALYLHFGSLLAFPLAVAFLYAVVLWVVRGFRRQPV